MIVYLLKSMLCLLALLLVHRLLLQREVLHRFNRFFLLASVVFSFLIPIYTIEVPAEKAAPIVFEAEAIDEDATLENGSFSAVEETQSAEPILEARVSEKMVCDGPFPWGKAILGFYLMVSAVFLFRFFKNLLELNAKIRKNPHVNYRRETLVLLAEDSSPFSFLKYIFVSRPSFEKEGISDAVFAHEQCHVTEKHSWDILFIEALMVPFWFHPGLYFARQTIRLNHEFIADQVALKSISIREYQQQLLEYFRGGSSHAMASSLNFSLTKKRLAMMKKNSGSPFKWMKVLVLVPLIGALVYFFAEKVTVHPGEEGVESQVPKAIDSVDKVETNIRILSDRVVEVDGEPVPIQELSKWVDEIKASQPIVRFSVDPGVEMGTSRDVQEMLIGMEIRWVVFFDKQGHEWETSSKEKDSEEYYRHAYILVEDENMDYTRKSYGQLTEEEKKPLLGPFIMKPTGSPDPALYEKWKDKETYAMWIDGIDIENDRLNDYSTVDFKYYFESSVMKNARSKQFPQPYQVHLYTKDYGLPNPLTAQDTITLSQRGATWSKDIQKYPDPNTAYLQKNARYENLRTSGTIYDQKSPEEKALLDSLYMELNSEYSQSSDKRKKSLKEPILPNSNTRRNGDPAQSSSEKISARTVGNGGDSDVAYSILNSGELQSKAMKEYLTLYGLFQTKANENHKFSQKSPWQIEALRDDFKRLHSSYQRLTPEERRSVQRANFPYAKIEKDGKVIYKKFEDLSPKEQEELMC